MKAPVSIQRLGETTNPHAVSAPASSEHPMPPMLRPASALNNPKIAHIAASGTNIRPKEKVPKMPKTQPSRPAKTP
jgi:hypothetical protein